MQLETANYLLRGVSPISAVNDYISNWRCSSLTLPHITSHSVAAQVSQASTQKGNKTVRTQALQPARPLTGGPTEAPEQGRERGGGAVWNGLEQWVGALLQTRFTKRHLFLYSNALWLITSWPVCEMTATYSPVNRKICTCSIWGVGEQGEEAGAGGRGGGGQGEREKAGGNRRNRRHPQLGGI